MHKVAPFGSYTAGATFVHKLDARTKLAVLLIAAVASFAASGMVGLLLSYVGLAVVLIASKTSLRSVVYALRPAVLILAFSLLSNAIVLAGQPQISLPGLWRAGMAVGKIIVVVGFVLVFSETTMPPAIAQALTSFLSPLARMGISVENIALIVSVALRFIPLTLEEVDRIRAAQYARGAHLKEEKLVARLGGWAQVLVPLLVGLFRRADALAQAMDDRCYNGTQTRLTHRLSRRSWLILIGVVVWAVLIIFV